MQRNPQSARADGLAGQPTAVARAGRQAALRRIKTDWTAQPADTDLAAWHRWQKWAAWLRACDYQGEVSLLEYYNAHVAKSLKVPWLNYCQSGPWPDNLMQKDFQFYVREGIAGWQNCTDYYNDAPNPYWNRLAAQLLWNPWADVAAIDQEFYAKYYGPAGAAMQAYCAGLWRELASELPPAGRVAGFESLSRRLDEAEAIAHRLADTALVARVLASRKFQTHVAEVDAAAPVPPR